MRRLIIVIVYFISVHTVTAQGRQTENALQAARYHMSERSYDSALHYLDIAIRMEPLLYDTYKLRADSRAMVNDLDGAALDYRVYLDHFPDDSEALFSFSELNYRLGNFTEARDGFLRLRKMPPGSTSRIYYTIRAGDNGVSNMFTAQSRDKSRIDNYLGLVYAGMNNYSRSLLHFDSALAVRPEQPDYLANKGLTYLKMNHRATAKTLFRRALEIEPGHVVARQNLANMIRADGNQDEAITLYSEDIAANPNSSAGYENRGYSYLLKGENRKALKDFDAALKRNANEPTTWLNRGIARMRLNMLEAAFDDFSMAIRLEPNLSLAYMNRGNVLYKMREYEDALNDYNVAIIYEKTYYLAYYHRGITQYKLGKQDEACSSLQFAATNGIDIAGKTLRQICTN